MNAEPSAGFVQTEDRIAIAIFHTSNFINRKTRFWHDRVHLQ